MYLENMKINYLTLGLLLFVTTLFSQNEEILFTVDEQSVSVNEFVRVYNKNIDLVKDKSQKDVDEYLKLYVNYKLKLAEAKTLKLDDNPVYTRELKSYRKQLAQKYLTDTDVNDRLIKEAYQRTVNEVNANHILVKCLSNASPQDSLLAYNKVLAYRKQAMTDGFSSVMQTVHDKENGIFGESLGYFGAFKMVYTFENVAFNTPVGEISMPFRTQFGFHIVHVLDKRKSQGEVEVAHIMVSHNNKKLTGTPKEKIEEINQQLKDGSDFRSLAKQFSDDRGSATKGGNIKRFGSGKISDIAFEKAAFELTTPGELTTPVKSKYGWHIIKLIKKFPVESLDRNKNVLLQKIKKDSRSRIVNEKFYSQLKKRYDYKQDTDAIRKILMVVDKQFLKSKATDAELSDLVLFSFAAKKHTYADYYKYLRSKARGYKNLREASDIVKSSFNDYVNKSVFEYQDENLENEYVEFATIMQEYREGLLLFDLMEKEVWNKAKADTLGLKEFYNENKSSYKWGVRVNAIIASSAKKSTAKKVCKLFKNEDDEVVIQSKMIDLVVSEGVFEKNDKELPSKLKLKKGVSKIFKHNKQYVLIKVKEVLPPSVKAYEEVRGRVINDYQQKIEKEWISALRQKYAVKVNPAVLSKVKKQL